VFFAKCCFIPIYADGMFLLITPKSQPIQDRVEKERFNGKMKVRVTWNNFLFSTFPMWYFSLFEVIP
jgi:hypothetical protein